MAQVSRCPECGRKVTLPEEVDPSELVRCPRCDGQFLLCEVTAQAELAPPLLVPIAGKKLSEAESQRIETLVSVAEEIARNAANLDDRVESLQQQAQELKPEDGFDVDCLLQEVDTLENDAKTLRSKAAEYPIEADTPDVLEEAHDAKTKAIGGVIGSIRTVAEKFDNRAAFLTIKANNLLEPIEVDPELIDTPPKEVSEPAEEKWEEEGEGGKEDEQPKDTGSDDASDGFASWLSQNEGDVLANSEETEPNTFSIETEPETAVSEKSDIEPERIEPERIEPGKSDEIEGPPVEPSEARELRSEADDLKSKATELRVRADALADKPDAAASPGMFDGIGTDASHPPNVGAFDFASGDQAASTTPGTIARPGRRPKKKKSAFREVLGIALGGIGGVLIALYGLAIVGGEKRSLSVYLPGVKHTDQYRPEWWPIWATLGTADDTDDTDLSKEEE